LADTIRILGIDPGSRITGYGILESDGSTSRYIDSGCICTESANFIDRLNEIYTRVRGLVTEFEPQQLAIEKVFVHRNADSALKLGRPARPLSAARLAANWNCSSMRREL
jgi:crossover junction endodeoxyribonuclease RuvC